MKFSIPREAISVREVDPRVVERLVGELNVSPAIATILAGRGLSNYDDCNRFFRPEISHFLDPFLFHAMERAAARVGAAIEQREPITIYGDYDADGVCATSLLMRFLKASGAGCDYYLPNRLTEGYGLSLKGIEELGRRGTRLIITVDCGIGARDEVARAKELGMDVLVTDHHEPHGELPAALALLDPKIEGCGYPDAGLAGVGVALKLCQALAKKRGLDDESWLQYLDIVSLGTAADIVPLTGENRTIVSIGFERLARTSNPGLRELMQLQGVQEKGLSTRQVVFLLAPCINAAGRLGESDLGMRLLLTDNPVEAHALAQDLCAANHERRDLDRQVQAEAVAWAYENCDPERDFAIVAGNAGWHTGVIGIAAARVVEKFYRPAMLFSIGADGMARGSGRSIPELHLLDALGECSDLLETFGGHAAAAGATIRAENIPAFRARFNEAVREKLGGRELVPKVLADAEVPLNTLSRKFFGIVRQMEPFGPGNMRPVLLCRGLRNRYEPRVVGKSHLKMTVTDTETVMDAIAFGFGERVNEVRNAANFSLAFALDENEWNGKTNLQMKVKGVEI